MNSGHPAAVNGDVDDSVFFDDLHIGLLWAGSIRLYAFPVPIRIRFGVNVIIIESENVEVCKRGDGGCEKKSHPEIITFFGIGVQKAQ
jgi:hypothetical protein